jgi:hypothetical protein
MQIIFVCGLTTGKYTMGSSEALGMPPIAPSAEDVDTQEFDMVILDDPPPSQKSVDAPKKLHIFYR